MLILLFVFGNHMGVLGVMLCYITLHYITLPCIVFKASVPLSFSLYSLCILQVDQLKIPTVKDMRHVDRKLKHCWDRSSHDEYGSHFLRAISTVVITHHTHFLICTSLQAQEEREKVKTQIEKDINWCPAVSTLHLQLMFDHVPFSSLLLNAFSAATARDHMVEQCPCVKINYKNAVVRTSATPSTL